MKFSSSVCVALVASSTEEMSYAQQPDHHQPSQSSLCTAQVVLNASCSGTPGSHSACAVRTPLGVDRKLFRCATEAFSTTCILPGAGCQIFSFPSTGQYMSSLLNGPLVKSIMCMLLLLAKKRIYYVCGDCYEHLLGLFSKKNKQNYFGILIYHT